MRMIKNWYLLALLALVVISCKEEAPKDYVTLQGKVSNKKSDVLTILGNQFKKDIALNEDGTFNDKLKMKNGFHGFTDGTQQSFIYLKNGYDLTLNFDADGFPNSIEFDGKGSGTNDYFTEKLEYIENEGLNDLKNIFLLDKSAFDSKVEVLKTKLDQMILDAKDLDTEVIDMERQTNVKMIDILNSNYEVEHKRLSAFAPGTPSPKFNYPDVNGKKVSLDDLKGKYVYIDVWATWCAPCKREIPFLKELNEQYSGKDLAIVSLSIDKMEDKEKWMKMVADENLKGIQIIADDEWNSEFVSAYEIQGIPRFILIDKEGNIVDADAPRPSDPRLIDLFKSLNI